MAAGDDRRIIQVTGKGGVPDLTSLNEALRLICENIYKLEGRVGEITLRDSLTVMGEITLDPP